MEKLESVEKTITNLELESKADKEKRKNNSCFTFLSEDMERATSPATSTPSSTPFPDRQREGGIEGLGMDESDIDMIDSLGLVSATSRKFTSRVMHDVDGRACSLKTPAFTVKGTKKTSPKGKWSQEMHDYVERTQEDWLKSSSTHEVVVKYS